MADRTQTFAVIIGALTIGFAAVLAPVVGSEPRALAGAQEECHPDYADPCVPFLPGDALDCDDLSPFVILVDPEIDPYQLDEVGVGDGIGCDDVEVGEPAQITTPVATTGFARQRIVAIATLAFAGLVALSVMARGGLPPAPERTAPSDAAREPNIDVSWVDRELVRRAFPRTS